MVGGGICRVKGWDPGNAGFGYEWSEVGASSTIRIGIRVGMVLEKGLYEGMGFGRIGVGPMFG